MEFVYLFVSIPALPCIEWLGSYRGIMLVPVHTSSTDLVTANKEQMRWVYLRQSSSAHYTVNHYKVHFHTAKLTDKTVGTLSWICERQHTPVLFHEMKVTLYTCWRLFHWTENVFRNSIYFYKIIYSLCCQCIWGMSCIKIPPGNYWIQVIKLILN
jgi:hypothetical protein